MIKEALEKIQAEVNAAPNDAIVSAVGGFLMDHVRKNPEHAALLLAEGKTITGSLEAMKTEARKRQKNGVGVLTDAEGFAIVQKYYGVAAPEPVSQPVPQAVVFEASLDDLL